MKDNTPKIKSVFIGCDPEFFLLKKNVLTTAFDVGIPGSKKEPFSIDGGVFIHPDNVTLEVGMPPMEYSLKNKIGDYIPYFKSKMDVVTAHLAQKYNNEVSLYYSSAEVQFKESSLKPEQNRVFGCDPDLNAYKGGEPNPPVDPARVGSYRFCGGHIHIGYDKAAASIPEYALAILGECMASPLFYNGSGVGVVRRYYYGTPGAFRKKPYGFEYRTPSNWWARTIAGNGIGNQVFVPEVIASTVLWAINNEKEAQKLWDYLDPPNMVEEYFKNTSSSIGCIHTAYTEIVEPWMQKHTNIDLLKAYGMTYPKKIKMGRRLDNMMEVAEARAGQALNEAAPVINLGLGNAQRAGADVDARAREALNRLVLGQARAIREMNVNQLAVGDPEWVDVRFQAVPEPEWMREDNDPIQQQR